MRKPPKPFKREGSPFYHYDFRVRGRRFCRSTESTCRREAEAIVRDEYEKAKALTRRPPDDASRLPIDQAGKRWFDEVAQHNVCADQVLADLDRLVKCPHLTGKRLCDITDNDVTRGVAWRRGHHKWGRSDAPLITPTTVNRSFTEPLQKIYNHAKDNWNARFDHEPKWKKHLLDEPEERVRELHPTEGDALKLARRPDYAPWLDFVHASGQRGYKECLIRWPQVNWDTRQITTKGKKNRTVTIPITDEIEAILLRCGEWEGETFVPHHPEWVFTYVCQRTDPRKGQVRGKRYPITKEGAKTQWRRTCDRAKVTDLRLHDLRSISRPSCCARPAT